MKFKLHSLASSALVASALALVAASASAAPVSVLAYKLGVHASGGNAVNAANGWLNAGGFNEANATAQLLTNDTLDYKNSFVDTSWSQVLKVEIAMYTRGVKVAAIDFSPGTSRSDFFSAANVTSTSYTDPLGALYFNIDGNGNYNRDWFIQNNYNGCNNDAGHWVVLDQANTCGWEASRISAEGRAFLYSTGTTLVNWNDTNGGVGLADVYAITITVDQPTNGIPEPATLALVGLSLAGAGFARKRAKQS